MEATDAHPTAAASVQPSKESETTQSQAAVQGHQQDQSGTGSAPAAPTAVNAEAGHGTDGSTNGEQTVPAAEQPINPSAQETTGLATQPSKTDGPATQPGDTTTALTATQSAEAGTASSATQPGDTTTTSSATQPGDTTTASSATQPGDTTTASPATQPGDTTTTSSATQSAEAGTASSTALPSNDPGPTVATAQDTSAAMDVQPDVAATVQENRGAESLEQQLKDAPSHMHTHVTIAEALNETHTQLARLLPIRVGRDGSAITPAVRFQQYSRELVCSRVCSTLAAVRKMLSLVADTENTESLTKIYGPSNDLARARDNIKTQTNTLRRASRVLLSPTQPSVPPPGLAVSPSSISFITSQLGMNCQIEDSTIIVSTQEFYVEIKLDSNHCCTDVVFAHGELDDFSNPLLVDCLRRGDLLSFRQTLAHCKKLYASTSNVTMAYSLAVSLDSFVRQTIEQHMPKEHDDATRLLNRLCRGAGMLRRAADGLSLEIAFCLRPTVRAELLELAKAKGSAAIDSIFRRSERLFVVIVPSHSKHTFPYGQGEAGKDLSLYACLAVCTTRPMVVSRATIDRLNEITNCKAYDVGGAAMDSVKQGDSDDLRSPSSRRRMVSTPHGHLLLNTTSSDYPTSSESSLLLPPSWDDMEEDAFLSTASQSLSSGRGTSAGQKQAGRSPLDLTTNSFNEVGGNVTQDLMVDECSLRVIFSKRASFPQSDAFAITSVHLYTPEDLVRVVQCLRRESLFRALVLSLTASYHPLRLGTAQPPVHRRVAVYFPSPFSLQVETRDTSTEIVKILIKVEEDVADSDEADLAPIVVEASRADGSALPDLSRRLQTSLHLSLSVPLMIADMLKGSGIDAMDTSTDAPAPDQPLDSNGHGATSMVGPCKRKASDIEA